MRRQRGTTKLYHDSECVLMFGIRDSFPATASKQVRHITWSSYKRRSRNTSLSDDVTTLSEKTLQWKSANNNGKLIVCQPILLMEVLAQDYVPWHSITAGQKYVVYLINKKNLSILQFRRMTICFPLPEKKKTLEGILKTGEKILPVP